MATIGTLVIDMIAQTARLRASMDRNARTVAAASRRMERAMRGVRSAALLASTALGGLFTVGEIVGTIARFEQAMANVEAVSRATSAEMRS